MAHPTVVVVIPARYASQRLPAKPLIDLGGKPMIQHVYEQVRQAKLVERVLVATDDERIAKAVRNFGGEAVMTSPLLSSGSDRVAAVAGTLTCDIVVNVQGDEPLIPPAMIDQCVELLLKDEQAQVGTLVYPINCPEDLWNPNVVKVVFDTSMYALYFSRSAIPYLRDITDREKWYIHGVFYKHVGIYVYRREFLLWYTSLPKTTLEELEKLEQLRILEHGYKIKIGITSLESIAVDTEDDVERVRRILHYSA
ncbi:MAG: 3-deoxy-manno-octulosonate cytidylyltransferase [Bacteroidetes bacterium]|nr:3-deoxy-manno-octulosonate cytidylyltransferase [Bacteroidota bacterium]